MDRIYYVSLCFFVATTKQNNLIYAYLSRTFHAKGEGEGGVKEDGESKF